MEMYRNKSENRIFVVDLTGLCAVQQLWCSMGLMETHFVKKKYVRLYIAFVNLMVNVDQQHNVQRQTPNKTGNVRTNITLW
jgi:hypothetical protein